MPGIERGYESGTRKGKGRGSASTSVRSIRVSGWTRESRATPARVTRTQCAKTSAEISVSAFHSCSQGVSFLELRSGNHRFYGMGLVTFMAPRTHGIERPPMPLRKGIQSNNGIHQSWSHLRTFVRGSSFSTTTQTLLGITQTKFSNSLKVGTPCTSCRAWLNLEKRNCTER